MPVYLPTPTRERLSLTLVGVLLALRFPLLFAASFGWLDQELSLAAFLCGTYLCTGLFLCLNLERLDSFGFSLPALLFFLGAPVLLGVTAPSTDATIVFRMIVAVTVGVYLLASRRSLRLVRQSLGRVAGNLLFTLLAAAAGVVVLLCINGYTGPGQEPFTPSWLVDSLCFQLSFAAVMEEPLFRGFLWGYLRRWGLSPGWTAVAQAGLFWVGHLYYLPTGLNFWLCIPLAALLLGLVRMRTGSVAYSMVLHTLLNSLLDLFRHMVRLF